LLALSEVYEGAQKPRENFLAYTPGQGFSTSPVPPLGRPAAGLVVEDSAVFLGLVDESGRYDASTDTWSTLPDPGNGYIDTAVSMGPALAISMERSVDDPQGSAHREAAFYAYTLGSDAWQEMSAPPFADWYGPALAWTGKDMLAWGGVSLAGGDVKPLNQAARYDPALDSWSPISLDGAPTSPAGEIVWTGSEAVAWGGSSALYPVGDVADTGGLYDPDLDRWRPTAPPPSGTGFGFPAVVAEGRVVSFTGLFGSTSRVSTYDLRDDSWGEAPTRCGPPPRRAPVFTWVGDGIVVWGGWVWQNHCDASVDPAPCYDAEQQRLYYLPAAALFGDVRDTGECTCPAPR
jgi:hypothetical protein